MEAPSQKATQPEREPTNWTIQFDADVVRHQFTEKFRSIHERTVLAIRGLEHLADGEIELDDVYFAMYYNGTPTSDANSRSSTRAWLVCSGLRDAIDLFAILI